MQAMWNQLNESFRSSVSTRISAFLLVSLGFAGLAAGQAVPKVVLSQATQLAAMPGGGVISSGNYAGTEIAINQQGNVFLGEPNGGDVVMINGTTGALTKVISGWGNPEAVLVDSANNLYIASLYTTQVEVLKIPYVSGAYVTATAPTSSTPACTGTDTVECYVANLTNGNDGYYFQTRSMTFDAAGNFYFAYGTSTGSNIFECTASCLTTGSPQANLIYADTGGPGTNGATYGIGGMTVDSAGNLFFTDSAYHVDSSYNPTSYQSNLKELVYTAGTGFAATPVTLQTMTPSSPGAYDDEITSAVWANGVLYWGTVLDGIFAYTDAAGVVNVADPYTVSTQGGKAMTTDGNGNFWVDTYNSGDVFVKVTSSIMVPQATVGGTPTTAGFVVALNDGSCVSTGVTFASSDAEFSAATSGTCSAGYLPNSSSFAATATFTPTSGGVKTTTLTATDSQSAVGTAAATGTGIGVALPVISLASGSYSGVQMVTITDATPGATIYYTTDGTTPTTSSAVYSGAISVGKSETLSAFATAPSLANSPVITATYTITAPVVVAPTFSPVGGTYMNAQTVTISTVTASATIYYTTDGTPPTTSSALYTAPITVSASETVKAIATAGGGTSSVGSASYTINSAVVGATNVIFNQTNGYVGTLNGGTVSSLNPTGTTVAVNQQGNLIAGNTYGGSVLLFNGPAGTSTTLGSFGNVGPELVDSANNLWIAQIGGTPVAKIPYAAGTYAVAAVTGSTPLCTGVDTVECVMPFSTSPAFTAAISGVVGLAMDPAGNLFYTTMGANPYSGPPSAPVYNAVYECNLACLYSATATPTLIYQETVQSSAANQYVVGAIAVDKWDDVFFVDSRFQPGLSNGSSVSNLKELLYTAGTGYAATPTTLYTYTNSTPGSYDDYLMGLATDANGTVYLSGQYDGVYGFPNNHGVVNTAGMYAVTTQGAKAIALDSTGDVYELTYNGSAGGDVAVFTAVNNLVVPTATVGGAPTTATDVTVILNDAAASTNPTVMIASSDSEFSAVTTGTASGVGLSTGAQYGATITFTPTTPGTRTSTLTGTDSASNMGSALVTGLAKATVLTPQTITFTAPASPVVYGVSPITLVATASSGLPVSFAVASGPGTVSGNTLTVTGAGTIVVTATQAGNTLYLAAPPVSQSVVVTAEGQTITFPAPTSPVVYGVAPITLTATASSGLAVSYTVTSGPGTVSGSTLTVTGAGTIVVAAAQAGNTNFSAATSVSKSVVVTQATATVAITPIAGVAPGSTSATVTGTVTGVAGGTLPGAGGSSTVTCNYFNSANTKIGSTTGQVTAGAGTGGTSNSSYSCGIPTVVTGTGGTYTVNVFFNGDTNYLATTGNGASFNVLLTQTISFTAATPVSYGVAPITLVATASSGLPVTFAVTSGPGTISGSTLTVTGVGTIVVSATQAGNGTYAAATAVSQSIVVNQEAQTISFTVASPVTYGIAPITLAATSSAGLPVSFTVTSGPGTISGNTLTVTNYGTIVITATQAGNTNVAAATAVSQSLVVNALGTVATPTFSVAAGTYNAIQTVTITDATAGATIYYTVTTSQAGGSTGTPTVYTGPITVGVTETLSAYAIETGYVTSGTAIATYTLPVNFTLSEDQNALQVTYGYSGYVNVTVTPEFGFSAPVTFACSGLPTGATCTFSPASVTPVAGAPVTTQVSVAVPATSAAMQERGINPLVPGGATLAAALCCFGLHRRRRIAALLMVLVGLVGMGMLSGCGSTTQATPAIVTKNVTVTATSGSVVQTITFALTEQ